MKASPGRSGEVDAAPMTPESVRGASGIKKGCPSTCYFQESVGPKSRITPKWSPFGPPNRCKL
uniref:Uncharacterized protein n=1 Tax=Bursaphelenchus xylophilus TaxID=6326 RepID=A0A1I7SJY5_BURXY